MPVPDDVIFAPKNERFSKFDETYYGMVRQMDDDERIIALKHRLDYWLIGQIDELGKEEGGESKVYAPFPLTLLTCVAIETIGIIMFYDEKISDDDNPRNAFLKMAAKVDSRLSRTLKKEIKEQMVALWAGPKDASRIKTPADLLYTYLRNTLIHRYQGLGVQITEEATKTFEVKPTGTMVIDPYWLWRQLKKAYEIQFLELIENKESTNSRRKSALRYVELLLA